MTALLLAPVASGAIPTLVEVRAHNFEVMTTEGKRVPLGNLVPDGRPAVVEFWATWCAPCCKTIPHLIELSKRYGDARLAVLGLTVESPVTDTAKVASEMGINYAVAFAPRELFQFMNRREQVGVPKLIIYDAAGNVVEHILTYSPFTNRRIESAVSRAFTAK
ncbi:MAG TPA: TlpA disulfide reductase family protein [Thermoanaerobaculia bacterium]|nr:TlpA disulfide reductase family protein [Thermoanaerobaculia bacterium]